MYYHAGTPQAQLQEVWLDGERQRLALEADDVQGWVTIWKADRCGRIDHDCFGRPKIETRYGKVVIRCS